MPNGNQRGNVKDRRARKLFLLNRDGDGMTAPCHQCAAPVCYATMIVDRIIPAKHGGTYKRSNIRVHCRTCSHRQGSVISAEKRVVWRYSKAQCTKLFGSNHIVEDAGTFRMIAPS